MGCIVMNRTTQTTDYRVLLIEDNASESIYAQAELAKAGYRNFATADTLTAAKELIPRYDAVLSDLFFPIGIEDPKPIVGRFLPLYESYAQRRFSEEKGLGIVRRAVEGCAEVFGVDPQQYVDEFMTKMNTPASVLKAAKDSLAGRVDSERYETFQKNLENVKSGEMLPSGIIATEYAKSLGKPGVIVTSTYHHDDMYEGIASELPVPTFDRMIDGHKDWSVGVKRLTELLEGRE